MRKTAEKTDRKMAAPSNLMQNQKGPKEKEETPYLFSVEQFSTLYCNLKFYKNIDLLIFQ